MCIGKFSEVNQNNKLSAPIIYVIDSCEHPLPVPQALAAVYSRIVYIPIDDWFSTLSPWPAPSRYREDQDFAGRASETLRELIHRVDVFELENNLNPSSRAIAGYSLGGLFALYTFIIDKHFGACGSLSASLWYPNWIEWLQEHIPQRDSRFVYFSVGTKEKRASMPFKLTEQRMFASADILQQHGFTVETQLHPGSHMQHIKERLTQGIMRLDHKLLL